VTRRPTAKAMGEAAAMARAFVESKTGKELREAVRRLITDDEPDAPDVAASDAAEETKEAKKASAGLITDDEPDTLAADQPQADAAEKIAPPKRGGGRPPVLSKEDAEAAGTELRRYLSEHTVAKQTEDATPYIVRWLKDRNVFVSPSTVYHRVVAPVFKTQRSAKTHSASAKTPPR
jgi:hypothetical protein